MNNEKIKEIVKKVLAEAEEKIIEEIQKEFMDKGEILTDDLIYFGDEKTPLPENKNYKKTLDLLNDGKSQSEISNILGVTIQSVRRYINWLERNGYYENTSLTELTDREEQVVELVYNKNKSFSEAAEVMGCTVENIKVMHDNLSAKAYLTNPIIKILYPDFYKYLNNPRIGFPANRYKLASQVKKGQLCYIYLTTPCKKIVSLVRVTSDLIVTNGRWPYVFDVEIIIKPKAGVRISEVGINKRLRQGDTHICISDQVNNDLMNKLNAQPDLTDKEINDFINEVDNHFLRQRHQN